MKKLRAYTKTSEGKAKMAEVIESYIEQGQSQTQGGSKIITLDEMNKIADGMIETLKSTARAKGLPDSVLKHFDSLHHSSPVLIKGKNKKEYEIEISFGDDLSRFSLRLENGDRTGDGVENIVSLFDTGYSAKRSVKGIWDEHEELGIITSLKHREGLNFMSESVNEFNRSYGSNYKVKAVITADPEYYTR